MGLQCYSIDEEVGMARLYGWWKASTQHGRVLSAWCWPDAAGGTALPVLHHRQQVPERLLPHQALPRS